MSERKVYTESELLQKRDSELLDLIRETVQQLNALADKLEYYAKSQDQGEQPNA